MRSAVIAVLLAGCAPAASSPTPSHGDVASLEAAEAAFDAESGAKGVPAAFHDFMSDEAWALSPGEPPAHGRAQLDAYYKDFPATDSLRWKLSHAEVSADGTMGWTWGTYEVTSSSHPSHGKYLTVWRREHGAWKVICDTGLRDPDPSKPSN